MKKILLTFVLLGAFATSACAEGVDQFIGRFAAFVEQVVATDNEELKSVKLEQVTDKYDAFMEEYNKTFKDKMSTEQLEEFNKYRGKYQKKMLSLKAKRKLSAVKGFVEGMKNDTSNE